MDIAINLILKKTTNKHSRRQKIPKYIKEKVKKCIKGKIKIGSFEESILVELNPWTREDYERQWREGLDRLKVYDRSCLVVSVGNPEDSAVVEWWVLYRVGNTIFVQNEHLSHDTYKNIVGERPFTPDTCYAFIGPRETHTEDGHKISEWSVPWTE